MSETNSTPPNGDNAGAIAADQGYAEEPTAAAPPADAAARRRADSDVKRRNLMATFGSGPGKLALIAVAVVVVVFGVLAASNLRNPEVITSKSQVDAPASPAHKVTTNTVTPEEAARRAEQSRKEAEAAHDKGGSYQPGFDYNIGEASKQPRPETTAQFSGYDTPEEAAARAQAQNGSARTMQQTPPTGGAGANQQQLNPQQQAEQQRREQEMQRATDKLATEQKTAEGERDKYVDSVNQEIVKQIGGLFSSQGGDSLNNLGSYSQTSYYTTPARDSAAADRAVAASHRAAARKAVIKAGSTAYATLDSEANTDDGRTVLATVRSGKWKGAKLIGQIEQSYNNMSLTFTTMAPQDDRPTMRVRAVALREADAKLGMAESIDHHTLSRYSALAAAALLQGAGRVYQQPIGTTVATNAGIITTTEPPRDRQVIGSAVGEMGMAIGSEIRRRGFNQPSTYSTPAETGFVLYFLEDVLPQSGDDQQQQPPQQNTQVNPVNNAQPVVFPSPAFGQGAGTPGFTPGYGSTPYGYSPGGYGGNQYPGGGYDNRYRGPLNSNY